jgi:thiamine biosynthesis protein ThiI
MTTTASTTQLYLVRLGPEVTTKSRPVRARFQQRLRDNIAQALEAAEIEHRIRNEWSRLFVEAQSPEALEPLSRVFGIHSLSAIRRRCAPTLEEIVRVGAEEFADDVRGNTFAVRAHRSGEVGFRSQDVHIELGRALNEHAKVDLERPDVTVQVEIRSDAAYFFSGQVRGAGGLPLGTQGRAVCLVSGGFDSAVAAWMMLKRGVRLDYVLCNLAGAAFERTVLGVVKVLADSWSYGTCPVLHAVDFQSVVADLRQHVTPRFVQVVLKRLMYRAGLHVARELEADAVITGESVGQVSSQTLANLRAIEDVADLPILRPLVGMDKEEIIDRSRHIGTYALSSQIQEYCAVVPDKPATAARTEVVRREESRLDMSLLDKALASRRMIDVTALGMSELILPYLNVSEVPQGAVVVDCREADHYDAWHYPDAVHFELDTLLENYRTLDKSKTYVLYCPIGLQSSVAAEKMQSAGYQAYSFKGGSQALRKYADERGLD